MTGRGAPGSDGSGTIVAARRTASPGATAGDFTYSILGDAAGDRAPGERRDGGRQRTRLRSGKIVDDDGRFVIECLIVNRSASGGLLRIPGSAALPDRILLYDDGSGDLQAATVIWRRGREIGIRFAPGERIERHQAIADSMRRKFYAMR